MANNALIQVLEFQHHMLFDVGAKDLQVELLDPINKASYGRICAAIPFGEVAQAIAATKDVITNTSLKLKALEFHETGEEYQMMEFEFYL